MTLGGWILLLCSWGVILSLAAMCFIRVFSKKDMK